MTAEAGAMTAVDVWMVPVWPGAGDDAELRALLPVGETEQISALGRRDDRDRAVCARAAARVALGGRLGVRPGDVRLEGTGRPRVVGDPVTVSWAHSGRWVALAIGSDAPVGIDIERCPVEMDPRTLRPVGVGSLEEFVQLEAASKATDCAFAPKWPPGAVVRAVEAPEGYVAAVAACAHDPATDLDVELHTSSPLDEQRPLSIRSLSYFPTTVRVFPLPLPSFSERGHVRT